MSAVDPALFRGALRRWASGVTIVTTRAGEQHAGMTASAFSSVSLAPPLVLICSDKRSKTLPHIRTSGIFAVNVLGAAQQSLSGRFAASGNEERRFDGIAFGTGATGAPRLSGVLAVLDCRLVAEHDAGDHVICVGEVIDLELATGGEPLVYYDASHRVLAAK